ncbi:hypothetical protein MKW94_003685 [Papaver nudicaule]|uniref:Transposase Tnp1/En/Spm-like domain-containing protein n=1 Tax=Papaver nudicaule TaxID=74823 RepID=A0AA41V7C9_PAPNU|nr:hypothetical protein [Papaver nudicaule]
MDKSDTIAEKKRKMTEQLIAKRENWEEFVDFCNTDEDREPVELLHNCGRTGIYCKIYNRDKDSPTGEINRPLIYAETHLTKTSNDPESTSAPDVKIRKILELVAADPDAQKDINNDVVAHVCGRDKKGYVRGIGGGLRKTQMLASAPSREILRNVEQENKSMRSDIELLKSQFGTLVERCASSSSSSNRSIVPASSCFIKNFRGKTIAVGSYNTIAPPMEHTYIVIVEEMFDKDAELYDEEGKIGDVMIGQVINWPKPSVKPFGILNALR